MAVTMLSNLINPQVLADMIDQKFTDAMKFAPLATIDTTLQGRAGDTITLPHWNYIGDASVLAENTAVDLKQMSADTTTATIHKIANGVELTDEAILSGYGDPYGEAARQIALSMAAAVDNDVLSILHSITGDMLYNAPTPKDTDITAALELFGEDINDAPTVALVSPAVYTQMRSNTNQWVPASEVAANIAVRGIVGEYQGCQIMVSNKLAADKAGAGDIYLVKPGALRIFLKRDTLVEYDRDILKFTNVITASKHYVAYLYNAAKAIRIGAGA